MSLISDLQGWAAPKARLSTPAPYDVPRWDDSDFDLGFDPSAFLVDNPEPVAPSPIEFGGGQMRLKSPTELLPDLFNLRDQRRAYASTKAANDAIGGLGNPNGTFGGKGYSIPKGTRTGLASQRGGAPYGLQPNVWAKLVAAQNAMQAAGLGKFGITDGFRSYAQQVALKRKKPRLAATPGRSKHGLGIAADLSLTKAQSAWLAANGAKFGLRRPMSYEPWHVEGG